MIRRYEKFLNVVSGHYLVLGAYIFGCYWRLRHVTNCFHFGIGGQTNHGKKNSIEPAGIADSAGIAAPGTIRPVSAIRQRDTRPGGIACRRNRLSRGSKPETTAKPKSRGHQGIVGKVAGRNPGIKPVTEYATPDRRGKVGSLTYLADLSAGIAAVVAIFWLLAFIMTKA